MIKGAIHRPVTVAMFILAVSLFGYISLDRLSLNLLPDISYPTLTIQTDGQTITARAFGQVALDLRALPRGATISVELIAQAEQDYPQITTFTIIPS